MSDIQSMTDAELGEAIMREVFKWKRVDSISGRWLDAERNERVVLEITASLLQWMTNIVYTVSLSRTGYDVHVVRVLMPRVCEPVYTHADTLPRAVAEAALCVARDATRDCQKNREVNGE